MHFFDFENPVISGIYKFCYLVLLSVVWLIFCLPVFTAGASTTALYYTVHKNIRNDRGTVRSCFWQSFKENFRQAVPVTLLLLAILLVFGADISILNLFQNMEVFSGYLRSMFCILTVALCVYAFWIFAYMARFRCPVRQLLKNALLLAVVHFPSSLLIVLTGALALFLIWFLEPLLLIVPAGSVYLMSNFTERVFRKYISEQGSQPEDY